jgi:hypothetical protein
MRCVNRGTGPESRESRETSAGYTLYPIPYARQPLQLIAILVIIFAAGTEDDARAFLALQRPEIFDIGQEFVCPSRRFLMTSRLLARLLTPSPTPTPVAIGGG